jgi:hypothetical protein
MRDVEKEGMEEGRQQALKKLGGEGNSMSRQRWSQGIVEILLSQPLNPLIRLTFSTVPKYESRRS